MDCVQAVRFMASRPTSDMTNLFAEGQSQGGAFTYAAAALSDYPFRAIAPAVAFLGDYPDYFRIVNWPANVARENQGTMTDEQMYEFLSYFDTKNLAAAISCPVIACIGLQDDVCPPHTNIAPYNNLLSADKQLIINEKKEELLSSRQEFLITFGCYCYVLAMAVGFDKIIILDSFNGSTVANYINIIAPCMFYLYFAKDKKACGDKTIAGFNVLFGSWLIIFYFITLFY